MNKIMIMGGLILLAWVAPYAQADSLYAYEYSTNYPHEIHHYDNDDYTYRSNKSRPPIYQQQYSQQPQIIVYPNIALRGNQDRYWQRRMEDEHEEHEWRERERDEEYMQRRRWELEHQPHARYYENQFYRDDTHW
jgi:hypothetical protein